MRIFANLLTLVIICVASNAIAQTGTITGQIKDSKSGETLIGVNVILEDNTGGATDLDGNFTITASVGPHTLNFKFIGYKTQVKQIEVKENETITLNISLVDEAHELGIVVVSAGKFEQKIEDVTVSMEVIKPSLVENKGSTTMETAVNQTPGVQVMDSEVQIRSGSGYSFGAGSRVMVMVDDLPVLSGDAGRPKWGFLPVENLEQIEVIKGASSVLYGSSALNGVINIRTAYPKDSPQTKINAYSGVYDNPRNKEAIPWKDNNPTYTGMNFFHSRKIGNLDLVIGGNAFSDQGYIGPEPEDGKHYLSGNQNWIVNALGDTTIVNKGDSSFAMVSSNEGEFENRMRMNMNLRYRSKAIEGLDFGVNFNGMYQRISGALIMLNVNEGMYRSFPGTITRTLATVGNIDPFVNYNDGKGNRHRLRSRLYYVDNNNDNNQANKSLQRYGEYQYQRSFKKVKDMTMTTGIVGSYSTSNSELYKGNSDTSGVSQSSNMAGYLQIDKKFFERITLSAGTRYERFNINDTVESKPVFRTGLSSKLFGVTYGRASFGQGYRFPTIAEKFIQTSVGPMEIFPNPQLQSETSWNAEVGLKQGYKIGEFKGYLDVAYFHQQIQNVIEFNFGQWRSPSFTPQGLDLGLGFKSLNVNEARIRGVDVSLVGTGNIGPVTINVLAGHTYSKPEIIPVTENATAEQIRRDSLYYTTSSSIPSECNPYASKYNQEACDTMDSHNILKYRFHHMSKADIEFIFKGLSAGMSFRYTSYMYNIDKAFEVFDDIGILPTGIKEYRIAKNFEGDYVFDLRLSYELNDKNKVAIIVNNALNREYMIRPLMMESPRTFAVQYTLKY